MKPRNRNNRCLAKSFLFVVSVFQIIPSAFPSQQDDPFGDFGNDFAGEFDEFDAQDRFHNKIDKGLDKWEDRCLKVGGQKALDNWLKAQENLVYCVMQNFPVHEIQTKIEIKKQTGDLDLVFKEYCNEPVKNTRPCIEDFLKASRACLNSEDQDGLNITMNMIDSAIDFMCHNSGDRIAIFMSEDGLGCVQNHSEEIMSCVNASVPDIFNLSEKRHSNIHLLIFNQENCRKGEAIRHCVEKSLLKCNDPTPSNVVNSMLGAMKKVTPCRGMSAQYTAASAPNLSSRWLSTLLSMLLGFVILQSLKFRAIAT